MSMFSSQQKKRSLSFLFFLFCLSQLVFLRFSLSFSLSLCPLSNGALGWLKTHLLPASWGKALGSSYCPCPPAVEGQPQSRDQKQASSLDQSERLQAKQAPRKTIRKANQRKSKTLRIQSSLRLFEISLSLSLSLCLSLSLTFLFSVVGAVAPVVRARCSPFSRSSSPFAEGPSATRKIPVCLSVSLSVVGR